MCMPPPPNERKQPGPTLTTDTLSLSIASDVLTGSCQHGLVRGIWSTSATYGVPEHHSLRQHTTPGVSLSPHVSYRPVHPHCHHVRRLYQRRIDDRANVRLTANSDGLKDAAARSPRHSRCKCPSCSQCLQTIHRRALTRLPDPSPCH